jgi:nitrogen-specific signal transduction histidine kinase
VAKKDKTQRRLWDEIQGRLWSLASREVLSPVTMGLAHDLNNLLTGVYSISDLCLRDLPADHRLREPLEMIRTNGQRASEVVRTLFFEHEATPGRRELQNLNTLVQRYSALVRAALPKSIELELTLASDPLPVRVDAVGLRTALLQLALNAGDAIEGRGKLRLRTFLQPRAARLPNFRGRRPAAPVACLELSDSGTGIDPAFLKMVFDPLFTTKAARHGAGLGLHFVREFAEKSGGGVAVEARATSGSKFTICLPIADLSDSAALETKRPRVFLAGRPGAPTLVRELRRAGWDVGASPRANETLVRILADCDVLVICPSASPAVELRLIRAIRRQRLPIKIIALLGMPSKHKAFPKEEVDAVISGKIEPRLVIERIQTCLRDR